jgi:16S rRNA (guanine966-N2)-methyltransferase
MSPRARASGESRSASSGRGASSRVLRIIAGSWRGRRFRFSAAASIRPTPDRVRETLFNWLRDSVAGARCLDLFAGSGALGLEALSRGAARVQFVDSDAAAAEDLRARLVQWGAQGGSVARMDVMRYLRTRPEPFEIVFLDPPFAAALLGSAAGLLEERGWLAPGALIYLECAARAALPDLPVSWIPLKAKRAGEVGYHLFQKNTPGGVTE